MTRRRETLVCAACLSWLTCVIVAMPPTERRNSNLEEAHTQQHGAGESQNEALDADYGEDEYETYDDDVIYDDEEYLHLLLGLNGSAENYDGQKTYISPSRDTSTEVAAENNDRQKTYTSPSRDTCTEVSAENDDRQETYTSPSTDTPTEAVTGSSVGTGHPSSIGDQGAHYERNLQPQNRSWSSVDGMLNILSVPTDELKQSREIDAGAFKGNSVGPTFRSGSAMAAEDGGLSPWMTTTDDSVTDSVEQLVSRAPDCEPAGSDDLANHEEDVRGQNERRVGARPAGAGQLLPCGKNVHIVARQPGHRGSSADMSQTSGTSGQLAGATSDSRVPGLGLDAPVVIHGLNGHEQRNVGDEEIHNGDIHRNNNYNIGNVDSNIGNVDSNIDFSSGGANRSRSTGTNIHLFVTPIEQVDAVLPISEEHQDKTGELRSTGHQQSVYNTTSERNETTDNISSDLVSPDATNAAQSMTNTPLEASFSDVISTSQFNLSSTLHDITSPRVPVIPNQSQPASHSDHTHDSTVDNDLTTTISPLAVSQPFPSRDMKFQMTEFWSEFSQPPTLQPQSTDTWQSAYNGENRNPHVMATVNILSTFRAMQERVQETTEHAWTNENNLARTQGDLTFKITSSTTTSLTPSTEDVGQPSFTDHSPAHVSRKAIVSSTSPCLATSTELEISETNVVDIKSATITVSTHVPSLENNTILADNPGKDGSNPISADMAVASPSPTDESKLSTHEFTSLPNEFTSLPNESISLPNESTSPANESTSPVSHLQPLTASINTPTQPPIKGVDSTHLPPGSVNSTESLVVHTETSLTSRQSSADIDKIVSDTSFKPEVYPTLPANTTSATEPAADTPSLLMELKFRMSWPDFCQNEVSIRDELVELLHRAAERVDISSDQLQLVRSEREQCHQLPTAQSPDVSVHMYLVNKSRQVDANLTQLCAITLQLQLSRASSGARSKLMSVRLLGEPGLGPSTDNSATHVHDHEGEEDGTFSTFSDPGVTIAVVLATVGGCYCLGVIVLQIIIRCRGKDSVVPRFKHSFSLTSSDSIQLTSVSKSRPNSGLFNPAWDFTDQIEKVEISNQLNFIQLSKMCMNVSKLHEEYQKIPRQMARLSVVPAGDEDKNRYANVLPLAHTRVRLLRDDPKTMSSYINANYVTGPNKNSHYYIATQAPTENTTADFWTMVWQQDCRVIVMLTQLEEEGQVRCASYWPEHALPSAAQLHGHFRIELHQKDVRQEFIHSRLQINNLREIQTREVDHFWYTCWPPDGVPEPISLVKLVLDTRPRYEAGSTPLVVHCSPGTGRTCTFIALDLCMRQFEEQRMVDIMKTVHSIRQERAGAVQNKEQYTLLYNALNEYAMVVASPVISAASSAATLHALLQS